MSEYSLKERLIARFLSQFPILKRIAKSIYVQVNYNLYRKKYKYKFFQQIGSDQIHCTNYDEESFFGYYDKCPSNSNGWVINHLSKANTRMRRPKNSSVDIVLTNVYSNETIRIGSSNSYTWQQGSRAQWLDDDLVIFNDYDADERGWVSKVFSLTKKQVITKFKHPVQDSYKREFFVSINYKRLQKVTEDYGYNNEDDWGANELRNNEDGLFLIDFKSGDSKLLHSLEEIAALDQKTGTDSAFHTINHVMINKSGTHLMFIHRYYINGVRKDRLIVSDFKSLRIISDNDMVSHCCWYDNNTIYGFLRNNSKDGYYFIDINTLEFELNEEVDQLGLGDGHPHVYNDCIVFDTYPDRSRMQSLYIYNVKSKTVTKLLEVFQSPRYKESSRCDLHPRFSIDGSMIFFDSVFESKRKQYYIKLK